MQPGTFGVIIRPGTVLTGNFLLRDLPERQFLGKEGRDINPEAVDAFVEPEPHQVVDLPAYLGIFPVQVRLLYREIVQVVGVGRRIELPGFTVDVKEAPAVGRLSLFRRPPVVIIPVGIVAGAARLPEPLVLVAAVVDYQVHDQLDPPLMHPGQHLLEVRYGAELGHDVAVVADVVAIVVVGRLVDRVQPDHIHAQALDIIQLLDDPPQIADAVAIAVPETARVDLVDHRFFPPVSFGIGHSHLSRLFLRSSSTTPDTSWALDLWQISRASPVSTTTRLSTPTKATSLSGE